MPQLLKLHRLKFLALAILANLGLQIYLAAGAPKPWADIDWMDVVAEGGAALLCLVWFCLLLKGRPAGRVTNLLALALGCIFFSWWMDCLDEFIDIPAGIAWDNWLESAPMPVGLLLLTLGLYHWHQEQLAISAQMEKRERLFREHRLYDKLTPLGGADYLRRQLTAALQEARGSRQPLSLIIFDLDDFSAVNRRYGEAEGDLALQAVSQLALLNLRSQDLLCRLAGDRFVALLPNTGERQARQMAEALQGAILHLAHHTRQHGERVPLSATATALMALEDDPDQLLQRLNLALLRAKQPIARARA